LLVTVSIKRLAWSLSVAKRNSAEEALAYHNLLIGTYFGKAMPTDKELLDHARDVSTQGRRILNRLNNSALADLKRFADVWTSLTDDQLRAVIGYCESVLLKSHDLVNLKCPGVCYCCTCGEFGSADPYCRNHGYAGVRACVKHESTNKNQGVGEDGHPIATVQEVYEAKSWNAADKAVRGMYILGRSVDV
jgi:hypothetical protein